MTPQIHHLKLITPDELPDGRMSVEYVEAEARGQGAFRLCWTPVAVNGFAIGDLVVPCDAAASGFRVAEWGGRIGIQWFLETPPPDAAGRFDAALASLGGAAENFHQHAVAGSVPHDVGHRAVATAMDALTQRVPGSCWQYANAWTDDDEAPLPWARAFLEH